MASLKALFLARLTDDATLSGLLTGGIHDSRVLPRAGISPTNVPDIYNVDGITIKPFAAVTWGNAVADDASVAIERRRVDVYIYQNKGYETIDAVLHRLKTMFHDKLDRQLPLADDAAGAWVRWLNELGEMTAPELMNSPMNRATFEVSIHRSV